MENESLPQYMQIALSIAGRIAGGDVPEGAKISGRSKRCPPSTTFRRRQFGRPCGC